jgi:hypothetical protein
VRPAGHRMPWRLPNGFVGLGENRMTNSSARGRLSPASLFARPQCRRGDRLARFGEVDTFRGIAYLPCRRLHCNSAISDNSFYSSARVPHRVSAP